MKDKIVRLNPNKTNPKDILDVLNNNVNELENLVVVYKYKDDHSGYYSWSQMSLKELVFNKELLNINVDNEIRNAQI